MHYTTQGKDVSIKQHYVIWGLILSMMLCLCFLCLTGCGEKTVSDASGSASDEASNKSLNNIQTEYYDIQSEKEHLFEELKGSNESGLLLGMQYFQEEPIQFWAFFEEGERKLYLCRADGSRELLDELKDIQGAKLYMDKAGDFYCWKRSWGINIEGDDSQYIRKLDASGKELFLTTLDEDVLLLGLCQLADGSIAVLLQDMQNGEMALHELNPENGLLSEKPGAKLTPSISSRYIAAGSQGVLILDTGHLEGISEVSLKDGKLFSALSFLGTSYSLEDNSKQMEVQDFRMCEDGGVEILWADSESGGSVRETLSLSKPEKTVITLRTAYLVDNGWLQKQIGAFNRNNKKYQVVLETEENADFAEFGSMTAVQMATGKGPDILYNYILEPLYDLAPKGGFENLAPYMESSGIREEDYFPYAFSCWRDGDKIYTFRMRGTPSFWCINKKILGNENIPDIESLVDAMLGWEDNIYLDYVILSTQVLENLLAGSEDLWGMVDWENGVCDFSGELFAKILKAAKKYGLPYERAIAGDYSVYPPAGRTIECTMYGFKTAEELEKMNLVKAGTLFDDGCYPSVGGVHSVFAINANSAQKEGAWEFISYIMREDVQQTIGDMDVTNRAVHRSQMESELNWLNTWEGAKGGGNRITRNLGNGQIIEEKEAVYTKEDVTDERIEAYLSALQEAKEMTTMDYMRVWPIIKIIQEEAEYFFMDVKTLEETVEIINNRAGLYIGEQH